MLFEFENNIGLKNEDKLFDIEEGFFKGNMFQNLYEGYKDYKVNVTNTCNEMERDLIEIMMVDFAINDLNLYLDLHKEDSKIFDKFKEYVELYKKLVCNYEKKWQVLYLVDDTFNKYTWTSNPWPWEVNNV